MKIKMKKIAITKFVDIRAKMCSILKRKKKEIKKVKSVSNL